MALVARDPPLDGLRGALERARRGDGSIVLVSGEAGIGKISLVAEFAGRVAGRVRVLRGSCEDLLTPRVLGPFRDMARDLAGLPAGPGPPERDVLLDAVAELAAEAGWTRRR